MVLRYRVPPGLLLPKSGGRIGAGGGAQHKAGSVAAPWGLATLRALDGQAIVTLGWRGAARSWLPRGRVVPPRLAVTRPR